jgi:hypothetical protein
MLAGTRTLARISSDVVPSMRREIRRNVGVVSKVGRKYPTQHSCAGLKAANVFHEDRPWLTAVSSRRDFFAVPSMDATVHEERRLIRYSPEVLFDVVCAVDHYSEFLPWCEQSTVHSRSVGSIMCATWTISHWVCCCMVCSKGTWEKKKY